MIRIRTGNLGLCSAGFFFVATLATRHASCGWLRWFLVDLNPKLRLQYKDMCSRLLVSKNNIYEEKKHNNIYPEVAPVVNSDAAACNEMNDTILEEM